MILSHLTVSKVGRRQPSLKRQILRRAIGTIRSKLPQVKWLRKRSEWVVCSNKANKRRLYNSLKTFRSRRPMIQKIKAQKIFSSLALKATACLAKYTLHWDSLAGLWHSCCLWAATIMSEPRRTWQWEPCFRIRSYNSLSSTSVQEVFWTTVLLPTSCCSSAKKNYSP